MTGPGNSHDIRKIDGFRLRFSLFRQPIDSGSNSGSNSGEWRFNDGFLSGLMVDSGS